MTSINCQVCQQASLQPQSGEFIDYLSQKKFEIWACPQCGSMETRGDLAQQDYYGQAYYGSEQGKFSPWLEAIFDANHRRNAKQLYEKTGHPKQVLEIGCGRGYILKALKNLGCQVQGLESADAADWILNNAEVPISGVNSDKPWSIADNSQDLVIIWHVLEHVNDPNKVLQQVYQSLKPGGILCVSVPNCSSLQANIDKASWFHLDVPRHLFHFSRQGLALNLQNHGFQIQQYEQGELTQNLYGWWQTLANLTTRPHNNLLYRWLQGGEPWRQCPNKKLLLWQLCSAPLWLPLGVLAYGIECLRTDAATMTFYVQKP